MRTSSASMPGLAFCGLALLLMSCPALGQSDDTDQAEDRELAQPMGDPDTHAGVAPIDEEAAQLEKVTVTGSHIRRAQIEGPQPVQMVTPEMIREVGGVKLGDYLPYLTINQTFQDPNGNLMNPENPAGASYFDLRGLGPEATLTLINGRRVASFASGDAPFVNINAIPLAAIERIEILKDGASAIYGADAIAGVVNIILKDDYEGVDLSASYSDTEHGGAAESSVELVGGKNFGRTNFTGVLSWYDADALFDRDREVTENADQRWRGGYDGRSVYSSPPNALLLEDYENGLWNWEPDPTCSENALRWEEWHEAELCSYNFSEASQAVPENTRWAGQLFATHAFSPELTMRAEFGYSEDQSNREWAPEAVYWYPLIPAEHPGNPFGQPVAIIYRSKALGNRRPELDTDGLLGAIELQGFAGRWGWRAYGSWSESKNKLRFHNYPSHERMDLALAGQGGENADQWLNPFGLSPENDPDLIAWIEDVWEMHWETRERTAGLIGDAPVFALPAGDLGLAVGAEFRDEDQWQDRDWDGSIKDADYGRHARSTFVEVSVPVLDTLEVQLAGRYEDYSDFGSHFSPKIAVAWRSGNTLLLRASYGESFRAPDLPEVYEPASPGTLEFYDDPERCPVTGATLDCRGTVETISGGNPDLQPETGKSWYAGVVWSPRFLDGLDVQLDFWKFDFDDRVTGLGPDTVIKLRGNDPKWVQRADPTPEDIALGIPGRLELIYIRPMNLDKLDTRGVDVGLRYRWMARPLGEFAAEVSGTYVDRISITTVGDWAANGKNLVGTAWLWGSGQPRWRAVGSLRWARGPNSAAANLRFVGSYKDAQTWPDEEGLPSDREHEVASWTTFDLQYARVFRSLGGGTLSFGCANCADRDPPLYLYSPVDLGLHNAMGRTWFARWSQSFGGAGY